MKRAVAALLMIALVLGMCGCGKQTVEHKGVTAKVPKAWERNESDYFVAFYDNDEGKRRVPGMLIIDVSEPDPDDKWETADSMLYEEMEYFTEKTDVLEPVMGGQISIAGNNAQVLHGFVDFSATDVPADGKLDGYTISAWFVRDGKLYNLRYSLHSNKSDEIGDKTKFREEAYAKFEEIIKTVKVN